MRTLTAIRIGTVACCLTLLFALAACGGGGSSSSNTGGSSSSGGTNTSQTPTANAGPDQSATTGATVTLNGSSSTDPNGKTLTYKWAFVSVPSGSTATLSNATSEIATFVPDLAGTYTVSLIVNNGTTSSSADDATITVTSSPDTPTANAGPDQNGSVGAAATLDGSASSDPKGATLTYAWQITSAPSGSSATLSDATSSKPTFTPDVDGVYIFSLTVNNGTFTSAADTTTLSTVWMLNTTGAVAAKLKDSTGGALPVNVQSVSVVNSGGTDYYEVKATGIPDYVHTVTTADMTFLNGRPKYATDFRNGTGPSVAAGDVVDWASDINYASKSNTGSCYTNSSNGLGWWPPGPTCPTNQNYDVFFPKTPQTKTSDCYTSTGSIGMYRNGVPIYNWSDGNSYNSGKIWHQLAGYFEQYDLDLCLGHAEQQGAYHQHIQAPCLSEEINDTGSKASPVYGYAADGYPIYGEYESSGVKALSCWKTRDYDTPDPTTGCGTAHVRNCVLKDNTNPSLSYNTVTAGPNTTATVTTLSGNSITAVSGVYYEDYYFDSTCAALGGEHLDVHNGHDLHDGRGYHYHITDSFPYNIGPTFAGKLQSNAMLACKTTATAGIN